MGVLGEVACCCVGEAGIWGIACEVGMLTLVPVPFQKMKKVQAMTMLTYDNSLLNCSKSICVVVKAILCSAYSKQKTNIKSQDKQTK